MYRNANEKFPEFKFKESIPHTPEIGRITAAHLKEDGLTSIPPGTVAKGVSLNTSAQILRASCGEEQAVSPRRKLFQSSSLVRSRPISESSASEFSNAEVGDGHHSLVERAQVSCEHEGEKLSRCNTKKRGLGVWAYDRRLTKRYGCCVAATLV
jgi:hypothetical protein